MWTPPAAGNSVNTGNPVALRMIMDSLRYWFGEDGCRRFPVCDLAATLGRQEGDFDPFSAFFDLVAKIRSSHRRS